jgi:hypothetical protein
MVVVYREECPRRMTLQIPPMEVFVTVLLIAANMSATELAEGASFYQIAGAMRPYVEIEMRLSRPGPRTGRVLAVEDAGRRIVIETQDRKRWSLSRNGTIVDVANVRPLSPGPGEAVPFSCRWTVEGRHQVDPRQQRNAEAERRA